MPTAFVLTVAPHEVELASDALWALGVRAVEERSAADGVVELWTHVGDGDRPVRDAIAALAGRWPARSIEVDEAPAATWRDHVAPMWIDERFVVVPAWRDPVVVADAATLVVAIEPGGAFGMGDHPTTRLCLRALRRLLVERRVDEPPDVLDVGCGTGVIAISAAAMTGRSVRAIDVSEAAVDATVANAVRNDVAALVDVDSAPLADVDGTYDLVFANILAPTLVELAADLRRVTRADGRLVISGILDARHEHVLSALRPMVVERIDVDAGWAAVTLALST